MNNTIYLIILCLFTCSNIAAQDQDEFIFTDGDQVIQLHFEPKQAFLERNKPTKMKILLKNIDPKITSVIGLGIKRIAEKDEEPYSTWSITPYEKGITDGKYIITVSYGYNTDGSRKICKFFIPVK